MKQRSLNRDREPKKTFQACARIKYTKHSYESKPCSHGSNSLKRKMFMKFYKKQRKKNSEVGLEITRLFKEFFYEHNCIKQNKDKPDSETVEYLGQLAVKIKELKETRRTRDDFPSFSSFYKFVKKEGVTLKELEKYAC